MKKYVLYTMLVAAALFSILVVYSTQVQPTSIEPAKVAPETMTATIPPTETALPTATSKPTITVTPLPTREGLLTNELGYIYSPDPGYDNMTHANCNREIRELPDGYTGVVYLGWRITLEYLKYTCTSDKFLIAEDEFPYNFESALDMNFFLLKYKGFGQDQQVEGSKAIELLWIFNGQEYQGTLDDLLTFLIDREIGFDLEKDGMIIYVK